VGQASQNPLFPALLESLVANQESMGSPAPPKIDVTGSSVTKGHSVRRLKVPDPAAPTAEHSLEEAGSPIVVIPHLSIVQLERPLPLTQTIWSPVSLGHEELEETASVPVGARPLPTTDLTLGTGSTPTKLFPIFKAETQRVAVDQPTSPAATLVARLQPVDESGSPEMGISFDPGDFSSRPAIPPSEESRPDFSGSVDTAMEQWVVPTTSAETPPQVGQISGSSSPEELPAHPDSAPPHINLRPVYRNPRHERHATISRDEAVPTLRSESSFLKLSPSLSEGSAPANASFRGALTPPVTLAQDAQSKSPESVHCQRSATSSTSFDSPVSPSLTPNPSEAVPSPTRNDSPGSSYIESGVVEPAPLTPVNEESGRMFQVGTASPERVVDLQNPVGPGSSAAASELAFQGHLIPVPETQETHAPTRPTTLRETNPKSASIGRQTSPSSRDQGGGTSTVSPVRGTNHTAGAAHDTAFGEDRENDSTWRPRQSESAPASRLETPATFGERFVEAAVLPPQQSSSHPAEATRTTQQASRPEPPQSQPQPAGTATVPRDIKLELSSGGQRVEVRVADHGGDVHVAVRTSDAHLAGALREDLPALSSRLEQSGLRADAWHTTPSADHSRRDLDSPAGSHPQNSHSQQHPDSREQQGQPERQRPRIYEDQPNRKEKRGKEFEWFMSSLR